MNKLTRILTCLSQGSSESVQSGRSLGDLDKYLHIKRDIEDVLCHKMDEIKAEGGGLILLVGSAGDGKSHLISSVRQNEQYSCYRFHNDATESYSPVKTAIDTLKDVLVDFSDENLYSTDKKLVLAINIGKLNAFVEDLEAQEKYRSLVQFISPLFEEGFGNIEDSNRIKVVQFTNQQIFEFDKTSDSQYPVDSYFLKEFLRKLTCAESGNPFYAAYQESIPYDNSVTDPVVINYQLLSIPTVQDTIIKLVIESIVRYKLIVTPREFQDFIYSILVYEDLDHYSDEKCFLESLLPTMLFSGDRSKIQRSISQLDPLKYSNTGHDNDLAALFTSPEIPAGFIDEEILAEKAPVLMSKVRLMCGNNRKNIIRTTQFLFRLKHIMSYHSECEEYVSFLRCLKGFFNDDGQEVQALYQMVNTVIPRHYGSYYSPEKTVPLNIQGSHHRLFATINISPAEYAGYYEKPNIFSLSVSMSWRCQGEPIRLMVDYQLYEYLYCLNKGKLSLNFDSSKNMAFSHFIRNLVSKSENKTEIIVMTSDNQKFLLQKQFGVISYRKC